MLAPSPPPSPKEREHISPPTFTVVKLRSAYHFERGKGPCDSIHVCKFKMKIKRYDRHTGTRTYDTHCTNWHTPPPPPSMMLRHITKFYSPM